MTEACHPADLTKRSHKKQNFLRNTCNKPPLFAFKNGDTYLKPLFGLTQVKGSVSETAFFSNSQPKGVEVVGLYHCIMLKTQSRSLDFLILSNPSYLNTSSALWTLLIVNVILPDHAPNIQ